MDGYSSTMRDHSANCYEAHGLSSAGSEQLANGEMPSNQADQAMMKAYISEPARSPDNILAVPQQDKAYGVPATDNNYDSYPDSKMDNSSIWGSGTPSATESTSDGGNVWDPTKT
jgi:hypothetical protein